ncbi:hypothetical protein J6590_020402 [Homalodisca vitripennis]|nr:hypothetical protein J6590_020402 [Homalodisca vitripennis]
MEESCGNLTRRLEGPCRVIGYDFHYRLYRHQHGSARRDVVLSSYISERLPYPFTANMVQFAHALVVVMSEHFRVIGYDFHYRLYRHQHGSVRRDVALVVVYVRTFPCYWLRLPLPPLPPPTWFSSPRRGSCRRICQNISVLLVTTSITAFTATNMVQFAATWLLSSYMSGHFRVIGYDFHYRLYRHQHGSVRRDVALVVVYVRTFPCYWLRLPLPPLPPPTWFSSPRRGSCRRICQNISVLLVTTSITAFTATNMVQFAATWFLSSYILEHVRVIGYDFHYRLYRHQHGSARRDVALVVVYRISEHFRAIVCDFRYRLYRHQHGSARRDVVLSSYISEYFHEELCTNK